MSRVRPAFNPHDHPSVVRTEVDEVTASLCELAGHIHAATAELARLLGRLDAIPGWQGVGIRSLGHWASIYLGIDIRTAAKQARVGREFEACPPSAGPAPQASWAGPNGGRRPGWPSRQPGQVAGAGQRAVGGQPAGWWR